MLLTPCFTHSYPKFPEFIWIFLNLFQFIRCQNLPQYQKPTNYWNAPQYWKFPAFIEFLENSSIFHFWEFLLFFSFFGNFYHFWKFHHFSILGYSHQIISILGNSHQIISILGNSHHFSGIYLLLSGLTSHIWNFLVFFRIFLDPFGIF